MQAPIRSLNSASNLHRRRLCPGSARMEFGKPDEENEFSAEGTMLHRLDANPNESRAELSDLQRWALDKNAKLRQKFFDSQMDKLEIPVIETYRDFVETEFFLCDLEGYPVKPLIPGHPDIVRYFPDYKIALLWDSKFGRVPVSQADCNDQLKCYAVMFAEHFECDLVVAAIGQPWLKAPMDFHCTEFTDETIDDHKRELLRVVSESQKPDAELKASISACRYCKAKNGDCPKAMEILRDFDGFDVVNADPAEMERCWPLVDYVSDLAEKYKAKMKQLAKEGKLVNYTLGKAQNMTFVSDYRKACEKLKGRVSPELLDEFSKLSLDELSKAAASGMGLSQKDARAEIERILSAEDLLVKKPKEAPLVEKD